jgi:hypothetical protein
LLREIFIWEYFNWFLVYIDLRRMVNVFSSVSSRSLDLSYQFQIQLNGCQFHQLLSFPNQKRTKVKRHLNVQKKSNLHASSLSLAANQA